MTPFSAVLLATIAGASAGGGVAYAFASSRVNQRCNRLAQRVSAEAETRIRSAEQAVISKHAELVSVSRDLREASERSLKASERHRAAIAELEDQLASARLEALEARQWAATGTGLLACGDDGFAATEIMDDKGPLA